MILPFISLTTHVMKDAVTGSWLFTAACAILVLLAGCGQADDGEKVETRAALTVELVSPATSVWPVELAVGGRVEAWQESVVSSEIGDHKLDEVLVNVGDAVKKGQLLARFNEDTIRAGLEEMEADVRAGEATLATSRDQLARTSHLVRSRAVSEESHRLNETTVQKNEAELSSARARLSARQLELRNTRVTAPDDGVISSRSATLGTVLASGSELFRLIRQNRLEWRAEVSSRQLAGVCPGQTATLKIHNAGPVEGKVRQLSPTLDNLTLNAICYVDLPESPAVRAGMFLSGVIRTGESPALHVPESAIVYRDGYTYVIRVGQDALAHQVKVSTSRRRDDLVEIQGDVSETDRMVVSGGSFVNEGDLVEVTATGRTEGGAP
ncbi:efflux RND transporter periplasmic adaptor subunit [Luteolibacter yonseiensis]|uniref:Efflux RND transporter periplasmic adaptor subunit n=1 Tax=Luteolibacter yonseiensis TaxID=1144680 RepID=A0A934R1W8_9BACT|nr:efflux RND transporter periplasmic adaptor subunit [Luteolibacter yonseiensis]MBK1814020.1 efflux RND transporter periplasmic adaptor subunit [Luteolibacter yonseiensis]